MPLFGRRNSRSNSLDDLPPLQSDDRDAGSQSNGRGSLFSRNRSNSPTHVNDGDNGHDEKMRSRGLFGSRRRQSSSSASDSNGVGASSNVSVFSGSPGGRGILQGSRGSATHRLQNDPALLGARQKVSDAEGAERAADRALVEARLAVREARQHVKNLEREVEEEYVVFVFVL